MISVCLNDICSRDYGEFTVIYDLRNKLMLKLDTVAADIWNFIFKNKCVEFQKIVDYITNLYDCDGEDVAEDIKIFLKDLYSSGTILHNDKYVEYEEEIAENTQKEVDDFEGVIIEELQGMNQLYSTTFEMTYACNEKCIHCYAHDATSNAFEKSLSIEKYKDILDQLHDLNCLHVAFTGGDPFMYKGFMEIYSYARKKGFVCDIFTNALYFADHQDVMDAVIASRPRALYVSLYGANANIHDTVTGVKGSFEKTISAVQYLKSKGISVVFNVMILSVNHEEIEQIITLAKSIGAEYRVSMSLIYTNSGSDSPMNYFVSDKADIKKTLRIVNKNMYSFDVALDDIKVGEYMCSAGVTSLSVAPDGTVYPCISLKNALGNINKDSVKSIWYGNKRKEVMDSLRWENTKECSTCKYQSNCPHCPGISQAETGDCFTCNTCDRTIAECLSEM